MKPLAAAQRTYVIATIATLATVLLGLVLMALKTGIGNYPLDDAYIVEHSVAGILSGRESRFIDSTPWEGVTSPAYVAVLVLFSLLAPISLAHWLVSSLATLALGYGWLLLCRRRRLGHWLTAAVVLTSFLAGMTSYQLTNGIETGMAMAAVTWTLLALEQERPPSWGYGLVGMLYFIRPELAALSAIFMTYVAIKRPAGWPRGALIALCSFALPALALFLAAGTVIPNTASAKAYFAANRCTYHGVTFGLSLMAVWRFLASFGLFAAGFAMAALSRYRLVFLSFIAVFLFAYGKTFPVALFFSHSRYLYLFMPIAVFGWITCLAHPHRLIRLTGRLLGTCAAILVIWLFPSSLPSQMNAVDRYSAGNTDTAVWVAQHLPQDAVIAVHDAGKISLIGKQPLIDLVGLKSRYAMEVHRRLTYEQCKDTSIAISDIVKHAQASYLVIASDWDSSLGVTRSLRGLGWSVERADTERGDTYYKVYKLIGHSDHPPTPAS